MTMLWVIYPFFCVSKRSKHRKQKHHWQLLLFPQFPRSLYNFTCVKMSHQYGAAGKLFFHHKLENMSSFSPPFPLNPTTSPIHPPISSNYIPQDTLLFPAKTLLGANRLQPPTHMFQNNFIRTYRQTMIFYKLKNMFINSVNRKPKTEEGVKKTVYNIVNH